MIEKNKEGEKKNNHFTFPESLTKKLWRSVATISPYSPRSFHVNGWLAARPLITSRIPGNIEKGVSSILVDLLSLWACLRSRKRMLSLNGQLRARAEDYFRMQDFLDSHTPREIPFGDRQIHQGGGGDGRHWGFALFFANFIVGKEKSMEKARRLSTDHECRKKVCFRESVFWE